MAAAHEAVTELSILLVALSADPASIASKALLQPSRVAVLSLPDPA